MGNFSNKRYNRVTIKLLGFLLVGLFLLFPQTGRGQTLNCSFTPHQVPLEGTISGSCSGSFPACPPFLGSHLRISARYYRGASLQGNQIIEECDGNSCSGTFTSNPFNQQGWWTVEFCISQQCGSLLPTSYCLPHEAFFVLPPQCGDGVINQPSEECDDGNTVSGDGCDANCQLENIPGPPGVTLPTGYDNPLRWNTVLEFLEYILRMLFWAGIIVLFFVLLLASYYVITSGGSSTRILLAKKIFLWAFVGFVIILLGRAIIWLIQHL